MLVTFSCLFPSHIRISLGLIFLWSDPQYVIVMNWWTHYLLMMEHLQGFSGLGRNIGVFLKWWHPKKPMAFNTKMDKHGLTLISGSPRNPQNPGWGNQGIFHSRRGRWSGRIWRRNEQNFWATKWMVCCPVSATNSRHRWHWKKTKMEQT